MYLRSQEKERIETLTVLISSTIEKNGRKVVINEVPKLPDQGTERGRRKRMNEETLTVDSSRKRTRREKEEKIPNYNFPSDILDRWIEKSRTSFHTVEAANGEIIVTTAMKKAEGWKEWKERWMEGRMEGATENQEPNGKNTMETTDKPNGDGSDDSIVFLEELPATSSKKILIVPGKDKDEVIVIPTKKTDVPRKKKYQNDVIVLPTKKRYRPTDGKTPMKIQTATNARSETDVVHPTPEATRKIWPILTSSPIDFHRPVPLASISAVLKSILTDSKSNSTSSKSISTGAKSTSTGSKSNSISTSISAVLKSISTDSKSNSTSSKPVLDKQHGLAYSSMSSAPMFGSASLWTRSTSNFPAVTISARPGASQLPPPVPLFFPPPNFARLPVPVPVPRPVPPRSQPHRHDQWVQPSAWQPNLWNGNEMTKSNNAHLPLRPVIIDGSNVVFAYSKRSAFDAKGIVLCAKYFLNRGHQVRIFVPQLREEGAPGRSRHRTINAHMLTWLNKHDLLTFTPHRNVATDDSGKPCHRTITCYDDYFIVEYAHEMGGVIVSMDNYRDVCRKYPEWAHTINNRLLMFSWVGDLFMIPRDPMGPRGPSLEQFLRYEQGETVKLPSTSVDVAKLLRKMDELLAKK